MGPQEGETEDQLEPVILHGRNLFLNPISKGTREGRPVGNPSPHKEMVSRVEDRPLGDGTDSLSRGTQG